MNASDVELHGIARHDPDKLSKNSVPGTVIADDDWSFHTCQRWIVVTVSNSPRLDCRRPTAFQKHQVPEHCPSMNQ